MQELDCDNPEIWTQFEVSTKGYDQDLNTYGSDPWGSSQYVGLRISPNNVGPNATLGADRYMFLLCSATFQANESVHLMSARQLLTIGYPTPTGGNGGASNPLLERQVVTPMWRFQDGGNVSWHIIRLPPVQFNTNYGVVAPPSHLQPSEAYFWSQNPALLSQSSLADGYIPPWNAVPPALQPVAPDLLNFYDIRYPWSSFGTRTTEDIRAYFDGPCTVAFIATVRQPNLSQGSLPVIPSSQLPYVSPEDAFINTASHTVKYTRIAGAMTFRKRLKSGIWTVDDPCQSCGLPRPPSSSSGGGNPPSSVPHSKPLPPTGSGGGDNGGGKNPPPEPAPPPPRQN